MNNSTRFCGMERLEERRLLSLGAIDTSFSGDGSASYEYQGEQYFFNAGSFAVAKDGSVVLAGTTKGRDEKSQILLAKVSPDGEVDKEFGDKGFAITRIAGPESSLGMVAEAKTVRLQKDGKIVVAGALGTGWAVFRFDSNGALDKSFDGDGIVTFQQDSREAAVDLELLGDGKILVGGTLNLEDYPSTHANDFGVVRLKADGTIDRTFGNLGFAVSDLGTGDELREMAVDRAGNIVVAGESNLFERFYSSRVVLLRYRPDGTVDKTFGKNGTAVTPIEKGVVLSLRTLHNRRILLSGAKGDGFLMRLDRKGRLDRGFGSRGIVNVDLGSDDDRVSLVRADRRGIVAVGTFGRDVVYPPEDHGQYLLHFRPDGSTDSSNARQKLVLSDAEMKLTGGARIVAKDRVLALFGTSSYGAGELTLARFTQSGAVDASFGDGGKLKMNVQGPLSGTPRKVITQADGKSIVLASLGTSGAASSVLLRMDAGGALDSSFGKGGRVDLDGWFNLLSIDLQGRIMLAGEGDFYAELVERFNADGSVDKSFGEQGVARIPEIVGPSQMLILQDGKILVAGYRNEGIGEIPIAITRLHANGSVDESFGKKGSLSDSFDGENAVYKLLVGADGKITAVGTADKYHDMAAGDPIRVFIGRYNADGSRDATFSRVLIEDTKYTYDSKLTSDGGVLILGHDDDRRELKVIRYKANGAADSTKVVRTAADIDQAFFDRDGSILVLTEGATLRLAADGSAMASGAGIGNLTYGIGEYETGFAIATITRDHKLLVTSQDEDGDLMLSRYFLG